MTGFDVQMVVGDYGFDAETLREYARDECQMADADTAPIPRLVNYIVIAVLNSNFEYDKLGLAVTAAETKERG